MNAIDDTVGDVFDLAAQRVEAATGLTFAGPRRRQFDAALDRDGYVHLTVHPRAGGGSGTPARAAAVDRFLSYAKAAPGVRFMTCRELAEYCLGDAARWRDARS